MTSQEPLTTEAGALVAGSRRSGAAGIGGPVLVQDPLLRENPAHFTRTTASGSLRGPSPDATRQGRLFDHGDTRRYRVGSEADHLAGAIAGACRDERANNNFRQAGGDFGKRLGAAVQALHG